ncbi:hypothetical protein AAZX31_02G175800 [Glycine max]|nr:hypothetical protein JHK86_004689 [Glycine max]
MTLKEKTIYQTTLASIPHYTLLECVLGICFIVMTILLQLPYEYIDYNPVPTIVFKGCLRTFHAFIIFLIFSFSGATNALVAFNKSRFSRLCGYYAIASMASSLAILLWALCCTCIN